MLAAPIQSKQERSAGMPSWVCRRFLSKMTMESVPSQKQIPCLRVSYVLALSHGNYTILLEESSESFKRYFEASQYALYHI